MFGIVGVQNQSPVSSLREEESKTEINTGNCHTALEEYSKIQTNFKELYDSTPKKGMLYEDTFEKMASVVTWIKKGTS